MTGVLAIRNLAGNNYRHLIIRYPFTSLFYFLLVSIVMSRAYPYYPKDTWLDQWLISCMNSKISIHPILRLLHLY